MLAAERGDKRVQCTLGSYCTYGRGGIAKDGQKGMQLYHLAADQGYVLAQYNLGVCYERGSIVPKDEREAVRLYQLAADQDFASVQNNLGYCFEKGAGVAKEQREALRLY